MILGILFSASQSKGGVFQYSMSVVNSLRKNKKIKSINIYTNNKNINLKGCNIVLIKNYNLLFILSVISGFFNFYPKLMFGKIDLLLAPSYSQFYFFQKQSLFSRYMTYKSSISLNIFQRGFFLEKIYL